MDKVYTVFVSFHAKDEEDAVNFVESMSDFLECRLCEELYQKISMTNRICSMCMQLHSKAEILSLLEE